MNLFCNVTGGTYGGYPVKFLVLITRLTKILSIKKDRVKELRDMNTEAEMMVSHSTGQDKVEGYWLGLEGGESWLHQGAARHEHRGGDDSEDEGYSFVPM